MPTKTRRMSAQAQREDDSSEQPATPTKPTTPTRTRRVPAQTQAQKDIEENKHLKIFLFPANIIGYFRIALLFYGLWHVSTNPRLFLSCYGASFALDVLDGPVARALGHSTRFGAALDMLSDKFSSPALLSQLSVLYPFYTGLFTFCLALDVSSHYFHMYATLLRGVTSHKQTEKGQNFIVKAFYGNRPFFGFVCLGHEFFLVLVYLRSFYPGPPFQLISSLPYPLVAFLPLPVDVVGHLAMLCFPSFVLKTIVHVAQLLSACEKIAQHDHATRLAEKKK